MVDRRQAVRRGTHIAARLHRHLDSRRRTEETGSRIDVFDAIARSGVPLLFRPLDGLLGVFMPEPMPGIMVTTKRQLSVQRYTAAHELGHLRMQHLPSLDDSTILQRDPFADRAHYEQQELEADAFAAEFLMPRWLLAVHFGRQDWSSDNMTNSSVVYQLSLRIGASYDATCRALFRHGLVSFDTLQHLLEVQPQTIKRELLRNYRPASGWSDVWLLTERDEGATISGSRSDLFVLKLREHSNAGYLWDFEALDNSGFAIVCDEREAPQSDLIGGELTRLIVAESSGAQSGDLRLSERRPWMPQDRPLAALSVSYDLWGPEREGMWRIDRRRQLEAA